MAQEAGVNSSLVTLTVAMHDCTISYRSSVPLNQRPHEPFTKSGYLSFDHHLLDFPGGIPHAILHVRKERGGDVLVRKVGDYAADADVRSLFFEAEDFARPICVEA